MKEIATNTSYRKRFLLGAAMQTVAQWSGGNGITYYIPDVSPQFSLIAKSLPQNQLTKKPDIYLRRCSRHQHKPDNLRRLRHRKTRLHPNLHLGSRRHLQPATMYANLPLPTMHNPHLHVDIHVSLQRHLQQIRLGRCHRFCVRVCGGLVYRSLYGVISARDVNLPEADTERILCVEYGVALVFPLCGCEGDAHHVC